MAATLMFDEEHRDLPQPPTDHNVYTLGSMHGHNVVIAGLPVVGNAAAATVATQMRTTFPQMKFGFLVGIGGGVPTTTGEGPIRLGHVIVGKPAGEHSGTLQYDYGKAISGIPTPTSLLSHVAATLVRRRIANEVSNMNLYVDLHVGRKAFLYCFLLLLYGELTGRAIVAVPFEDEGG